MYQIAVLVPCYNEAQTIEKVVRDFKAVLPQATVFVYDNNSSDGTAEIAEKAGAVVRHEYMQGKGNVLRRMLREIHAECYIMVDGDDTYPAEYAPEMARMVLEKKVDMVVGDRLSSTYFTENKRRFHNFGNSIVRKTINKIFKSNIQDVMTGYRALSYNCAKTFPVVSSGFEIETELTIHSIDKNLFVENIVVDYRDRPDGSESKLNTVTDGVKVIGTIIKLCKEYRPMFFFGMLALLLLALSVLFFVPVFIDFLKTGLVLKIPTVIVCGITFLTAVISFFSGMILSNIASKSKQDFELLLCQTELSHYYLSKENNTNQGGNHDAK